MHPSDESLVAQVAQGDRNALETLYDRHAARVLGFSIQIVGERSAAEELLQETFWQVWQKAGTFSSQHRSFTSWLFMIVRDLRRAANVQRSPAHQGGRNPIDQESILDVDLKSGQLRNALRNLPHQQRQVIELAFFQGMTRQEIASSTGETLDTISRLAQLGMQKLQEVLERDAKKNRK